MNYQRLRRRMIADIEAGVVYTRDMIGRDSLDERVMSAMREVRRENFVPADMQNAAFRDGALPIGHGQTISQPYMVAVMSDLLELNENDIVLEIGTGSGYQAAILARLAQRVYSIERIPALEKTARRRLQAMDFNNIETRCGDGYRGWPEQAPFDGIVVTAAAPFIPPALIDQLRPGRRMLIPVGMASRRQQLMMVTRDRDGKTRTRSLLGVAFVPMVEGK